MSKTQAIVHIIEAVIFGFIVVALCQPHALPWNVSGQPAVPLGYAPKHRQSDQR